MIPWYTPTFSRSFVAGLLLLIVASVVLTCIYYVYMPGTHDERVDLYIDMWRTFFESLAFFLIAKGVSDFGIQQEVNISHFTYDRLQFLLVIGSFWTLPLEQAMYSNNCTLQTVLPIGSPDPQDATFHQINIAQLAFIVIDSFISVNVLPTRGQIDEWRMWFRSTLVQHMWKYKRPFLPETTVLFVEQNLFPRSPRPKPSLWARLTNDLALFLIPVVIFLTLIGTVLYYWLVSLDVYEQTDTLVAILDAEFLSLVVILIGIDNDERNLSNRFDLIIRNLPALETVLFASYDTQIAYEKSINLCNPLYQGLTFIEPPDAFDAAFYNADSSRRLFMVSFLRFLWL